jgi:predicted Fe-Mo cluster-binding NifX family protein
MRKIALATEGSDISSHFGHCQGFTLFDIEQDKVVSQTFLANPGHKPGLLPALLHQQGVHVVVAGGMGQGAIDLFMEAGIDVITGAQGSVMDTLDRYLAGDLLSTGSVCHDHAHSGNCGQH